VALPLLLQRLDLPQHLLIDQFPVEPLKPKRSLRPLVDPRREMTVPGHFLPRERQCTPRRWRDDRGERVKGSGLVGGESDVDGVWISSERCWGRGGGGGGRSFALSVLGGESGWALRGWKGGEGGIEVGCGGGRVVGEDGSRLERLGKGGGMGLSSELLRNPFARVVEDGSRLERVGGCTTGGRRGEGSRGEAGHGESEGKGAGRSAQERASSKKNGKRLGLLSPRLLM
jgi:hypothetical protein